MASFLASGRRDFSLPNSSYAVRGDFASVQAAPVNPSLLSLFDRQLNSFTTARRELASNGHRTQTTARRELASSVHFFFLNSM